MSEARLDQLVKGAPPVDTPSADVPTSGVADPLAHLPSSPPQIYLNLLILEASLRAQYLDLRARRRQHTFFLTLLALWTGYFAYALFFAPREDGSGVGGSVYWVVEVTEKVCLMGGVVTAILVWGTGQWERGIRWPRRWVGITNRGLRGFNCKIVVVKGPWWKEWLNMLSFFFSSGLFFNNGTSSYRFVPPSVSSPPMSTSRNGGSVLPNIQERPEGREEDLSPGGDTIALLLLPKPFSPTFRENWDSYRSEYWERENERRRQLSKGLRAYERDTASKERRSWWKRLFRPRSAATPAKDVEKHGHHHGVQKPRHLGVSPDKEKRLRSGSVRSGSQSQTSSRSSTPTSSVKGEDGDSSAGQSRRNSTASQAGRKKRPSSNLTPVNAANLRALKDARPAPGASTSEGEDSTPTPEPEPLNKNETLKEEPTMEEAVNEKGQEKLPRLSDEFESATGNPKAEKENSTGAEGEDSA